MEAINGMLVWLAVGGGLLLVRGRVHHRLTVAFVLWLTGLLCAAVALISPAVTQFNVVMGSIAFVNASIVMPSWDSRFRVTLLLGLAATVAAMILVLLGAFSSLPVMAAAAVVCLGTAVLSMVRSQGGRRLDREATGL
jgi:hypothetical protein